MRNCTGTYTIYVRYLSGVLLRAMEKLTLTALRQQLFSIVDRVIETGVPVEIERRGHRLKIVLDEPRSRLANLRPHQAIVGDPEDLVELEVDAWQEERRL